MTMKRQNITSRKDFTDMMTDDEKMDIARKYHFRCAHCGATTYPMMVGGRGTVDHYIPLSKGGVSQSVNYVYLCEKCNKEKGSLILDPQKYLRYIDAKPYEQLRRYFYDYLESFEYFNRRNLLACDAYTFSVSRAFSNDIKLTERIARKYPDQCMQYYSYRKIGPDQMQEAGQFYIAYLRKYNLLASEESAWDNLEFWNQFGVLYGVYNSHFELRALTAVLLTSYACDNPIFSMFVFSPYSDKNTRNMTSRLSKVFAIAFSRERHYLDVRIRLCVPSGDPGAAFLTRDGGCSAHNNNEMLRIAYQGFYFPPESGGKIRGIANLVADPTEELDNFYKTHDYTRTDWMVPMISKDYHYASVATESSGLCRPFRSGAPAAAMPMPAAAVGAALS